MISNVYDSHISIKIFWRGVAESGYALDAIASSQINWVKQVGELLPDAYDPQTMPQVGELDESGMF